MEQVQQWLSDAGVLIWPIVAASVIVLALVIERTYFWLGRMMRRSGALRAELLGLKVSPTRVKQSGDSVAVVFYEFLRRPYDVEGAVKVAETYLRACRRHHGAIQLFAGLSTSLGLFGTVVGIAVSFQGFDAGKIDTIVGGLSTALYTTIAGLIVYVFGTLCLAAFEARAAREQEEVEAGLNRIRVQLLDHQRARSKGGPRAPALAGKAE